MAVATSDCSHASTGNAVSQNADSLHCQLESFTANMLIWILSNGLIQFKLQLLGQFQFQGMEVWATLQKEDN